MAAMRRLLALAFAPLLFAGGCSHPPQREPGSVAAAYVAAGRYEEAAQEIELAVRAHPSDLAVRRQAAEIQARVGNLDAAIGHLETAIQLSPADPVTWMQLAELEQNRENVADAYVAYRRAAELAPDDLRAVSGLALTADSLGFEDEAEKAYQRWNELERGAPLIPSADD